MKWKYSLPWKYYFPKYYKSRTIAISYLMKPFFPFLSYNETFTPLIVGLLELFVRWRCFCFVFRCLFVFGLLQPCSQSQGQSCRHLGISLVLFEITTVMIVLVPFSLEVVKKLNRFVVFRWKCKNLLQMHCNAKILIFVFQPNINIWKFNEALINNLVFLATGPITQTCPCTCNILQYFTAVKMIIFRWFFFIFFLFLLKNIDCGYTLEPPHWGGSNEYPQSMF